MSSYYQQDYYYDNSNLYNYDYEYNYNNNDPIPQQSKHRSRNLRRGTDLVAAASGGGDCCPHVVDSGLFAATLAAIPIGHFPI